MLKQARKGILDIGLTQARKGILRKELAGAVPRIMWENMPCSRIFKWFIMTQIIIDNIRYQEMTEDKVEILGRT